MATTPDITIENTHDPDRSRLSVGYCSVRTAVWIAFWIAILLPTENVLAQNDDELSRAASWVIPGKAEIQSSVRTWLEQSGSEESAILDSEQALGRAIDDGADKLDATAGVIVQVRPDLTTLLESAAYQRTGLRVPKFQSVVANEDEHPFIRNNLRLLFGRWLVQNAMHDEAIECLQALNPEDVVDPATLLFYRGLAAQQLLQKESCVDTMTQLLERESELPDRYRVLANIVLADIQPLEADSLDEIARLMNDIQRRQSLYRSGTIVRGQEQDVVDKLDQLIEQLEQQQQQQQGASSNQSSQPMQDSRIAGGKGDGTVTPSEQKDGGQWGDLPPEQRAAAMAEMSRDLPPHYRPVIEEYFRQMAADEEDQK